LFDSSKLDIHTFEIKNEIVSNTLKQLQPFNWDTSTTFDETERQLKPLSHFNDGSMYEGEWHPKTGLKDGRGVRIKGNGERYDGYWKDGMQNGYGRLIYANGDIYEGMWDNDRKHGKGVLKLPDTRLYNGDWLNDKKHGNGVLIWPDGNAYDGDWHEDKM